jgi:NADP-dependent 3-hydroxy acid dehydrogenase YdfG
MNDKQKDMVKITGASAGLVLTIAREFAKLGASYTDAKGGCSNSNITRTK